MLDRAHLSKENGNAWCDEYGRIFIYYSAESIMKDMCCRNEKATKLKKELINIGLIECKKQGQGKPDKIFVLNFEAVLKSNA